MKDEAALNGQRELQRGRDLIVGERDRHAPLRQLDRQRRRDRQPVFRDVDQEEIARTFVGLWIGRARENRRRGGLRGSSIKRVLETIDHRVELGDQPACRVRPYAHVLRQRNELGREMFQGRLQGLG